jgi:glutamate racemase
MPPTIALIHAVLPALAPMEEALASEWPEAQVRHLLDEGLSTEIVRYGGVTSECIARMYDVLHLAVRLRPDAVLLTCTAYSTLVPEARTRFHQAPIYAVDQMMVETAVEKTTRIGVLATFAAGLEQQRVMLETEAHLRGKTITITGSLHPEAMAALRAGNGTEHDRILLDALPALAESVDIVLLAQVSMARVVSGVPAAYADRVLSSPRLAARALRHVLAGDSQAS